MSIQAVAWVLDHSQATLADRLVLIAIASHADARGWNAWPSVPLIAREARVGESTAYRSIAALEELGELTIQRRPGRPNRYAITALMASQIERGDPSRIERGPLSNRRKTPPRLGPESSEPSMNRRGRAREAPIGLPPALPDEVRAQGAQFMRAVRRGENPA